MLLSSTATRVCAVRPTQQARLVSVRPSVSRIRTRASTGPPQIDADELSQKAQAAWSDTATTLKEKWEKTEDKPGAIIVISGTIVALTLAFGLVNAIDKIPIISDFVELVGIGVTGWFTYRYLTVGPDRDELFVGIKEFLNKIYGKF